MKRERLKKFFWSALVWLLWLALCVAYVWMLLHVTGMF